MARFTGGSGGGSGAPGPQGPAGSDGVDGQDALWNFLGEYDNGADYDIGDVVTYNGGTYYRILGVNTGYAPGTEYWTTIAAPGSSGEGGDIADFTFELVEDGEDTESTMTIHNHDMTIRTTRDSDEDADISLNSADDIWLNAGDKIEIDANSTILLRANDGIFLNDPFDSDNQIATIGDLEQAIETGSPEVSFDVNGGTLGTQPTFTGDPLFSGTYVKTGPLVHFQIQVDMDNITNFGTGQYFVDLPFPAKYGYMFREGCLHDISANREYHISGHVYAGQSQMLLFTSDTQGNNLYDFAFAQGEPITLSTADNFHIAGTYIAQ